ncbi:hypothetical protein C7A12_19620 [Pseudomonas fluorescens]|nr:hypothetical protein C7A12_19620 [Pseudomonas fluorescens]PRW75898.1 hypothetical protein C7A13_19230 [Pseudomonas fluorescens]
MGAGLPAMTVYQTTDRSTVTPSSQASQLPHLIFSVCQSSPSPSISAWFCSGVPMLMRKN